MRYTLDALRKKVRVTIDQNATDAQLEGIDDVETLTLDGIIEEKLPEAARLVIERAPVTMLGQGVGLVPGGNAGAVEWESGAEGKGPGSMDLPEDFLRLVTFRMSDWERSVTMAITENDVLYGQQRSRWGGVRGCTERPVVAVVTGRDGLRLEFYSCDGGEGVEVAYGSYIGKPSVTVENGTKGMEVPELLLDAVVNMAGYLVAASIGEAQLAEVLRNVSVGLTE